MVADPVRDLVTIKTAVQLLDDARSSLRDYLAIKADVVTNALVAKEKATAAGAALAEIGLRQAEIEAAVAANIPGHQWDGSRLALRNVDGGLGTYVDLIGPKGDDGEPGPSGDGWAPVFANEADGERSVQRVIDWIGGTGDKPAVGKYVGPTGFVDTKAAAFDNRGARGPVGAKVVFAQTMEPSAPGVPALWFKQDARGVFSMLVSPGDGSLGTSAVYVQDNVPGGVNDPAIWFKSAGSGPMQLFIMDGA